MQRLFSLKSVSSKLADTTISSSLLHRLPYKTPTPLHPQKTHPFISSHFTTTATTRSFSAAFLSKHQIFSPSNHPATRGFIDARLRFLRSQFHRQSFNFKPTPHSHSHRVRSWFRRLTANDMVLSLIVANVGVFMLWRVADRNFMLKNFTLSLENFRSGRMHTLITSAFSHIDTGHIISNMIGLYFFGMHIGRSFGPEFLLKLYLAGALGGSVFYLIHHAYLNLSSKGGRMWNGKANTPGLGASGAVNAIMLLDIFLFPTATLYFEFIIPVPAILLGIFLIAKDTLRIIEGDSQISGSAHLGGAAVGAIAWALVKRGRL